MSNSDIFIVPEAPPRQRPVEIGVRKYADEFLIRVGPTQTIDPTRYAIHISAAYGLRAPFLWPESLL